MRVLVFSLATSGYDQVFRRNIESQQRYAARHGYDFSLVSGEDGTNLGWEIIWLKVPLMLGAFGAGYDAVLYLDSDVMAADDAAPVTDLLTAHPDYAIFLANGHSGRPNSGIVLCRNAPSSIGLLTRILRSAGSVVPPRSRVNWGDNSYFIQALENEPAFRPIDRAWNNTEEFDGQSHFYHFTGPLRAQYKFDAEEQAALEVVRQAARGDKPTQGFTGFIDRHQFFSEVITGYEVTRQGREEAFSPFDPAWLMDEPTDLPATGGQTSPMTVHVCLEDQGEATTNPYITQLLDHLGQRGTVLTGVERFWTEDYSGIDVLHLHWIEVLSNWKKPDRDLLDTISARLGQIARTTRIVLTIHNLHIKADFDEMGKAFLDMIGQHVDAFIHLTAASIPLFKETHKEFSWIDKPTFVIGHGNYDVYFDRPAAAPCFPLPKEPYVLIFGSIRNADELALADTVAAAMRIDNVPVVIAGLVAGHVMDSKEKTRLAENSDALTQRFHRHVPKADIPALFNGARLVFLPRVDRLNSGVQYLAYTFLKPVVAPDSASMGAEQATVAGLTFAPGAGNAIAAIKAGLQMDAGQIIRERDRILQFKNTQMNWDNIADQHMHAYRDLLGGAVA